MGQEFFQTLAGNKFYNFQLPELTKQLSRIADGLQSTPIKWTKIIGFSSLPPECKVVLGYSPEWVHPDFNPEGIRECFYNDGWNSARWNNDQDNWFNDDETKPTHWVERPASPKI